MTWIRRLIRAMLGRPPTPGRQPTPARRARPTPASRTLKPQKPTVAPGSLIGSGGQGTVLDVPGHPDLAMKIFTQPIERAATAFDLVRRRGQEVIRALGTDDFVLCFPSAARGKGDQLTGYVMPKVPPEFYFDVVTHGGTTRRKERALSWAVAQVQAFTVPFTVTDSERLELVKLIARWLRTMHDHDLVYGDLSWANLAFSINQKPRLAVFDFDQTRVVGQRSFTGMRPAHTVDWDDPLAPDIPVNPDTDRYKFALLAYRMLVSKDLHSLIDTDAVGDTVAALDAGQVARVRLLWLRASGPWGTRPSLSEWVDALGA